MYVLYECMHMFQIVNKECCNKKLVSTHIGYTYVIIPKCYALSKLLSLMDFVFIAGNNFAQKKPFQIVRQSMPYGNLHDKAGLFFIGYAAAPENFEYMLSNMVGGGIDQHHDDVMRLTECIKGTYWYFPGVEELKKLA